MYNTRGISLSRGTGIQFTSDNEQIVERVKRIIMTNPYERVNNPLFGSLLETYIFQFENMLPEQIEMEVRQKIEKYEPSVYVNRVDISIEKDLATIRVYLVRKDTREEIPSFEVLLRM